MSLSPQIELGFRVAFDERAELRASSAKHLAFTARLVYRTSEVEAKRMDELRGGGNRCRLRCL